ncbi:MAG: SBBP repeat-containing protein [Planctomycetota bacterium]
MAFTGPDANWINAITIDAEGRIIANGTANVPLSSGGNATRFALYRFLADGLIDSTFGDQGRTLTNVLDTIWGQAGSRSIAIDDDGNILVAGTAWKDFGLYMAIARFHGNGVEMGALGPLVLSGGSSTEIATNILSRRIGFPAREYPLYPDDRSPAHGPWTKDGLTLEVETLSRKPTFSAPFATATMAVKLGGRSRHLRRLDPNGNNLPAATLAIQVTPSTTRRLSSPEVRMLPRCVMAWSSTRPALSIRRTVRYSWDINGDGIYGDLRGFKPTATWEKLSSLGILPRTDTYQVGLQGYG